jgi:hypothetical protein
LRSVAVEQENAVPQDTVDEIRRRAVEHDEIHGAPGGLLQAVQQRFGRRRATSGGLAQQDRDVHVALRPTSVTGKASEEVDGQDVRLGIPAGLREPRGQIVVDHGAIVRQGSPSRFVAVSLKGINRVRPKPQIPAEIEEYRDERWRREATRQVETALDAERFIEQVGFAACLTDSRRPGPSLYVAICGRRDAVMPRNVQKDPETSLTWTLKDDLVRRGKVYYAKLARGKTMFLAPRMIPCFHAIWGVRRSEEKRRLSKRAQAILKVLRNEWEMSTSDLRDESGVKDRQAFMRALDELQAAMIVVPSEIFYQPKFTYVWALGVGRFPDALRRRVSRDTALREIARCFLAGAGMTIPGELARVTGLSRPDAGRGNRALVAEGYATMLAPGMYRLTTGFEQGRTGSEFERVEAIL